MIVPVILCGGSGTRLWPLSRKTYPKQLVSLASEYSLLQDTVLRALTIPDVLAPIVICNEAYRFIVAEQLLAIGVENATIILEPCAKNTAPAAAVAACKAGENALLLVLPADHHLKDETCFQTAVLKAKKIAEENYLVTFGIPPTHPETGYGYIKKADLLSSLEGYQVAAFIEKPNLKKATEYLATGEYYWNSGMFMFKASCYLNELQRYAKTMRMYCEESLLKAQKDMDFIRLDKTLFECCQSDSIDYAVMEKSDRVALVPLEQSGWCDLGSWRAVYEQKTKDENNNVVMGDVCMEKVKNSYVHAEHRLLTVVGVSDHIIVETADAVLVAHKEAAQDIKNIVHTLALQHRSEIDSHRRVYRPWGYYEVIESNAHCKVKHIVVKSGKSLSLQRHRFRSEHWIVIQGKAEVTCGDKQFILEENQSTYVPALTKHRLKNPGAAPLMMIEVQTGSQLEEEDIERFDDQYGRHKFS